MRRTPSGRGKQAVSRRRVPRFTLDLDWFVESGGCSTLGRGLEISARGATLPVTCKSPFTREVTLYVSFPARPQMFKARCNAIMRGHGWVLTFEEVSPEDLQLLGTSLIGEFGLLAMPPGRKAREKAVDVAVMH